MASLISPPDDDVGKASANYGHIDIQEDAHTSSPAKKENASQLDTISLPKHLADKVIASFLDPDMDISERISKAESIHPFLADIDGYWSFSSESKTTTSTFTEGKLPAFEWNAHFRKAYTILFWVRPRIGAEKHTTVAEDDANANANASPFLGMNANSKRLLYRFGTSEEDASCSTGIAVSIGEWRAVEEDSETDHLQTKRKLIATLTAYSLPHQIPENPLEAGEGGMDLPPFVTASLALKEDEWSMIGITHVFPYLKRPQWTVCVNGRTVGTGELDYPQLGVLHVHRHQETQAAKNGILEHNVIFRNIADGGCELLRATPSDTRKKASDLQNNVGTNARHELRIHLASFLVASEVFTPTIQALLAQAGPTMGLQAEGGLPRLPPVANWTKGSSLEGPNVGIPLVVHGQSLRVQQLGASCVLWGSSIESKVLWSGNANQQTIVCQMPRIRGSTYSAPRVGLIQPTPPQTKSDSTNDSELGTSDPVCLTIDGPKCSIHHNISKYLLANGVQTVDTTNDTIDSTSKLFSLLMLQGQSLDCACILPFFLSLPPPGTRWNLQLSSVTKSLQHLFALFSGTAEYAACLLHTLALSIQHGGGRWHEELLQNGTLHVLASTLRQSLVRAEFLDVVVDTKQKTNFSTYKEWVKAKAATLRDRMTTTMDQLPIGPKTIPPSVVDSTLQVLEACWGPPSEYVEDLDPSMQIQRTSDLALTALFGVALDWDLWGSDWKALAKVLHSVSLRYGGICITSGYILRSQISVQFFLDTLNYKLQNSSTNSSNRDQASLRRITRSCSEILQAMLLSSLSNARSISQGEHDISSCMGALSDSSLGSVVANIVFRALVGILEWCEIVPPNFVAGSSYDLSGDQPTVSGGNQTSTRHSPFRADDDHKCKVASRMARNLMMSRFHDVIAPMLLSRTVFSAERFSSNQSSSNDINVNGGSAHSHRSTATTHSNSEPLSWQEDWRLCLMLFAWVTSIAGPEGLTAAKSLGSLLLASGLAGSLEGALESAGENYAANLFLPDPSMAMTIASTLRNDGWSYTDLLSDRLSVLMPIFPSLVVSLVSVGDVDFANDESDLPSEGSLRVLTELITAVRGSLYRVFGGFTHNSVSKTNRGLKNDFTDVDCTEVQAAKRYIPQLLVVIMALENSALEMTERLPEDSTLTILEAPTLAQKGPDDGTWIDVSSTMNDSFLTDEAVSMPQNGVFSGTEGTKTTLSVVETCQSSVLTTISELLCNAMRAAGGEASTQLWRKVLGTLQEVESYKVGDKDSLPTKEFDPATKNVLCRMIAMVFMKSLKRDHQWELWSVTFGRAISRLCLLIEEKDLLRFRLGKKKTYSKDQILLLCSLLHVLKYGRDMTGWCQLILPTPPVPHGSREGMNQSSNGRSADSTVAAAKVMLPILQPCLRVVLSCVGNLESTILIAIPNASLPGEANATQAKPDENTSNKTPIDLLEYVVVELRHSLMAAIVGLAFATARDIALHAMATLRRDIQGSRNNGDEKSIDLLTSLLCMTAEEIRVRYEGERRRRETALMDSCEDQDEEAAANSMAVEQLILGDAIIQPSLDKGEEAPIREPIEEISFETGSKNCEDQIPADFLSYNQGLTSGEKSTLNRAKMEWSKYEGLSAALQTCSEAEGTPIDEEGKDPKESARNVITALSPFLDAWDEHVAIEAVDTELVKLFDLTLDASSSDESSSEECIPELDIFRLRGSESAADAMTSFIELAASEKSRTLEVTGIFLPNHRNSCSAFAERFCWSRYMEVMKENNIDSLWERGIADGNRDVRSRLVSLPCGPQFRRFIPKYLDNSADVQTTATTAATSDDFPGESNDENDIDAFTKLLLKSGHLEIVDITKKEINEEDNPALELPNPDMLDDFDENPIEIARSRGDDDDDTKTADKADVKASTEQDVNDDTSSKGENGIDKVELGSTHFNITASAFASPPDNSSSTLGLMHSAAAGLIERHLENCLHVKTEGSRKCTMLLTSTHLIIEYDVDSEGLYEGELMAVREEAERQRMIEENKGNSNVDEEMIQEDIEKRQKMTAAMRPKSIRWNLSELSHVYLRRYRLRDSAIELFFIPSGGTSFGGYGIYSPSTSLFLDFGPGYEGNSKRDDAAFAIMKRAPPQAIKQWPDRHAQFLHDQLSRLTIGWVEGRITNFDYLLHLNMLAGRSYNDTCQYPIMPWVLSNYHSEEIPDLSNPDNFRDLSKPMGALNPDRLEDFIERFNTFADPSIPPFMYGSHYSTNAGVVLHFLVRLHPFAGLHRQLQGGHFDVADRLFASVPRTWEMCTGSSAAEVKELTPEWYCNPSFLKNSNNFKLGTSQDGEVIGDVTLPPWAKGSPEKFVEVMRNALESDICSSMLPDWIDLIFGRKQQGPEAIAAHNVFFYLTYYGSVDVAAIEDEGLRQATELQIAHFGQCPMQLFLRPHVRRVQYVNKRRLSFYQITSTYTFGIEKGKGSKEELITDQQLIFGKPLYLPFFSAPISHWVHLDAPPPGPHAPLISARLAGTDRCLAVDALGVFHSFRWAWKPDESIEVPGFLSDAKFPLDNGCFIAQRELPRFRTVPRLVHRPQRGAKFPALAISKTLFAGRSVLLVLSDGDGRGGLAMQLVDPAKGVIRGEAVISSIHSSRIECIATDPIGTAAGHGGVGGELAIIGSTDGTGSIWRFMSSHYLPLRPRVRLSGHCSSPIFAVGISAAINVAVTVSRHRLCLHTVGNGNIIRIIDPPNDTIELPESVEMTTTFADSAAVAISVQGFVVAVCETNFKTNSSRSIITLHLFSLEGVSLGSKALESWRGIPNKITATPDGTTILVCSGRGVTVHRLSAITPLEFIDEWQITESEELSVSTIPRAFDVDLGPSLNRPVVAAAACSNGALRLHALAGISAFSDRHRKVGISVGSLITAPARKIKNVFGKASNVGTKAAGVGKDISKEISSDVKERGVTGFLGGMFGKKK